MKLTFTFTNTSNLAELSKYDIFQTHFQLPDTALALPDVEERVMNIVTSVGALTQVCLHLTCRDLKWVNRLIKEGEPSANVWYGSYIAVVAFANYTYVSRRNSQVLKIISPIKPPALGWIGKSRRLVDACIELGWFKFPSSYDDYLSHIHGIRDNVLPLFNSEPPNKHISEWSYLGFFPTWADDSLRKDQNKRRRDREREQKQQEKEAYKKAEAKKPKTERIYFIQQGENGAIKIGYTTNPEKRLKGLTTASPYPLHVRLVIEGSKKLEKDLHDKFAQWQLDGEWFEPCQEIMDFIESRKLIEP